MQCGGLSLTRRRQPNARHLPAWRGRGSAGTRGAQCAPRGQLPPAPGTSTPSARAAAATPKPASDYSVAQDINALLASSWRQMSGIDDLRRQCPANAIVNTARHIILFVAA